MTLWQFYHPHLVPDADQIHVFKTQFSEFSVSLEKLSATLGLNEQKRLQGIRSTTAKTRFVISRGVVRHLLSRVLCLPPQKIVIDIGSHGKPALSFPPSSPWRFNLSHSGDVLLVAISRNLEMGIDVERVRPLKNREALVSRYFCRDEIIQLNKIPLHQRDEVFFQLWTKKEACLKMTGQGISGDLRCMPVLDEQYYCESFVVQQDYVASLCASASRVPIIFWNIRGGVNILSEMMPGLVT